MYAHIEAHAGGWWDGVLHPMESPAHLVTIVLVGLLGGWSVRAGRSSWTLPALFAGAMAGFGSLGSVAHRSVDVDPALLVLAAVLAMLFVLPRSVTRVLAPAAAVVCGALHGLAHGTDDQGAARSVAYIAGFTFTACLLVTVGSIVGGAVGRSLRGGRAPQGAGVAPLADDRALVPSRARP